MKKWLCSLSFVVLGSAAAVAATNTVRVIHLDQDYVHSTVDVFRVHADDPVEAARRWQRYLIAKGTNRFLHF